MLMAIDSASVESLGLVFGGLALFIYGISQMSDGLKSIAGYRIREYIEKYTSNLFMAILVGTIITAILHSSGAVTVISISLVRAGLMKLEQAIGITIGANIGTCVTSVMIGLNIEILAFYIVFIGVAVILLSKKKTMMYIGKVMLGFGLIFGGLQILGDQLIKIASEPWFLQLMESLGKQPWFALVGGMLATILVQSSTAVIGITQKLYTTGAIAPIAGVAFIYGANVGTTLTAIVVSVGGSVSTKRAAWFHGIYNVAGALIGMIVIIPFVHLVDLVNNMMNGNPQMWIAQAHLIFNVASTILIFPFVKQSVKLLKWLIPGDDRQGVKIETIDDLDSSLIDRLPAAALEVAKKNTLRMGRNVLENLKISHAYLLSKKKEDFDEVQEIEAIVNKYDTTLSKYLMKIAQDQTLAKDQVEAYSKNFLTVKNLERISDITVNLAEFYQMVYEERDSFTEDALKEIERIYELIENMIPEALEIFETEDPKGILATLNEREKSLNRLEEIYRDNHFVRMCENKCNGEVAASVFVDILSNMERIGDHALNIANDTLAPSKDHSVKYLDEQEVGSAA